MFIRLRDYNRQADQCIKTEVNVKENMSSNTLLYYVGITI